MHLHQSMHNNEGPLTRMNECEEDNKMNEWRRQKEEEEVTRGISGISEKGIRCISRMLGSQSKSLICFINNVLGFKLMCPNK